ncbi:MAG: dienelactone hydrolase family protein, partial [Bacteroidota bacterium]
SGFTVIIPDLTDHYTTFASRKAEKDIWGDAPKMVETQALLDRIDLVFSWIGNKMNYSAGIPVIGIGWGGTQAYELGMNRRYLAALMVVSGQAPRSPGNLARITAPVYSFLGGLDENLVHLEETKRYMKASRKVFMPVVFPGAQASYMEDLLLQEREQDYKAGMATLSGIVAILHELYGGR